MKLNRERKEFVFIGIITIIVVAMVIAIVTSVKQDKIKENLQKDPIIKVLFVIEDKNQALFTDVLIYYPVTGKGVLVNIPGNTGGLYSSLNRVDRIDSIYSEYGIETYLSEISKFIRTEIPFYIETSLDKFTQLTDILGGLEIFIPMPVDETSSVGEKWLLPSGRVTLDGEKVRTFMTYYLDDDTDANIQERRQDATIAFLSAIKANANIYLNKKNFNQIESRVTCNVKKDDLLELLQYISQVDTERFERITVTGTSGNVDGKSLLMPFRNGEYIKDVVRKSVNSIVSPYGTANARPYIIRILNGTKIAGLAYNTRILLEGAGFEVLDIGNTESEDEIEESYIINHIGQAEAAQSISDFIRCTNIKTEEIRDGDETNVSNVDLTLVLGRDFDGRWVKSNNK